MRLADDLLDYVQCRKRHGNFASELTGDSAQAFEMAILQAHRFVLSPQVQDLVDHLAFQQTGELLKSRHTLFLPAPMTWIEWDDYALRDRQPGACTGFLMIGDDLKKGAMLIVYKGGANKVLVPVGAQFQFDGDGPICERIAGGEAVARDLEERYSIRTGNEPRQLDPIIYNEAGLSLAAILALINAPRVTKTQPGSDLTRLNRARERKGRTPFLTWRTVVINVDAPHVGTGKHASPSGRMPLHFVRSHLRRIVGEWHLIPGHWRGNAEFGRVLKTYQAVREGERNRPEPTRQVLTSAGQCVFLPQR